MFVKYRVFASYTRYYTRYHLDKKWGRWNVFITVNISHNTINFRDFRDVLNIFRLILIVFNAILQTLGHAMEAYCNDFSIFFKEILPLVYFFEGIEVLNFFFCDKLFIYILYCVVIFICDTWGC